MKILILEDNKSDADLLQRSLNKAGLNYSAQVVDTRENYENALDNFKPDIILADYQLPSFDGVTAFHIKQEKYPHLPFIILSGTIGEEKAVGLIKEGLTDYALKDKLFSVPDKIKRALREAEENQKKLLAEQKLKESQAKLKSINDNSPDLIVTIDRKGIITYINYVRTGYTIESVVGSNVLDFVPEDFRERYKTHLTDAFNGIRQEFEMIAYGDNFQPARYAVRMAAIKTGDARESLLIISTDITDKRETEKALRQSEENLRAIFDSTDTGFLLIDTNFNIISFNRQIIPFAQKSFGFPLGEHANLIEMLTPERRGDFTDMLSKVLKKEHISYETSYPKTNRKVIWYRIKGNPVLNRDGNVTGICLAVDDISARKRSEEKLERQNKELQKTNTELDRFVYSTSHDLRAPLRSMLGLINIIKGGIEPGNKVQHERLEMMNKSIHKLDNFIQDILHYSHNSRMEVFKDEIQFEEMIQEIRNSLKFMEGTKELTMKVEIHQKEKFISDKRRVTVILNNLISNAIKYKDTSKDHSFVNIFIECSHENAIVKIEDNGIGIAGTDQEKIFEMFYRATTLSTGSGLGMYIVKETVEKIGATIHLESELDKGTQFIVRIPNLLAAIN